MAEPKEFISKGRLDALTDGEPQAGLNGWPDSNGMGGRIASEWVAGFPRNTQPSPAISRADYSLPLLYSTRRVTWGLDAMRSMAKERHISGGAASAGATRRAYSQQRPRPNRCRPATEHGRSFSLRTARRHVTYVRCVELQ
jgi:hypothetical protein